MNVIRNEVELVLNRNVPLGAKSNISHRQAARRGDDRPTD
jgi:hypothetical protein